MKNDSVEKLQKHIDRELSWRKRELSYLFFEVKSIKDESTPASKAIIRSAITMLYAHWEGAVKNMAIKYLEHVLSSSIPYSSLKINFIAGCLQPKIQELARANKINSVAKLIDEVLSKHQSISAIPGHEIISTESNLSSSVFKEIMARLGLDYAQYEMTFNYIDSSFLDKRNAIAHGERRDVDKEDYLKMHEIVIRLITEFNNQILESAISKSYIRKKCI